MKPTPKQKRMNLIAAFLVVIAGALALLFLSRYNQPIPTLKRQLARSGYACQMERNVDAGTFDGISEDVDAFRVGGERILIFAFDTFDDAAAKENDLEAVGESGVETYLADRYLLLYDGGDEGLKAALEKWTR